MALKLGGTTIASSQYIQMDMLCDGLFYLELCKLLSKANNEGGKDMSMIKIKDSALICRRAMLRMQQGHTT